MQSNLCMRIIITVVLITVFSACSSESGRTSEAEQTGSVSESASRGIPGTTSAPIPPNHSRIIGVVANIYDIAETSDLSKPCSQVPCQATIRIESVLGYGSAFGRPLAKGSEITGFFPFTLMPTHTLFPTLEKDYPGLSVGSRFLADVESRLAFQPGKGENVLYRIYGYEIQ